MKGAKASLHHSSYADAHRQSTDEIGCHKRDGRIIQALSHQSDDHADGVSDDGRGTGSFLYCFDKSVDLMSECDEILPASSVFPSLPVCHNAPVFNMDDPICHLGNLRIVGNHHNGLVKFLSRHLQQSDNIVAGFGIQISGGLISKL